MLLIRRAFEMISVGCLRFWFRVYEPQIPPCRVYPNGTLFGYLCTSTNVFDKRHLTSQKGMGGWHSSHLTLFTSPPRAIHHILQTSPTLTSKYTLGSCWDTVLEDNVALLPALGDESLAILDQEPALTTAINIEIIDDDIDSAEDTDSEDEFLSDNETSKYSHVDYCQPGRDGTTVMAQLYSAVAKHARPFTDVGKARI